VTRIGSLVGVEWRKSSYSSGMENCIEVADGFPGAVPVRDSKAPCSPALVFSVDGWSSFVAAVKGGEFSA
jgi:hypothetical protein